MALYSVETGLVFDEAAESFEAFEERLQQFFIANNIQTDLKELLTVLRDFFSPKKNVLAERYTFRNRKQLAGESLTEYVAALKGLASSCAFRNSIEEQLCDQFICGITSNHKQ